jgi:hypothetical protein
MRQIYATLIQCDLCGTTATVANPDSVATPPDLPDGWLGPVFVSSDYRGITPHDFCPGCASLSIRDVDARLREMDKEAASR